MATPPTVNTRMFSSKYSLNKSLSDSPDEVLRLQGISWWKRRAVLLFSLTLCVEHTTDKAGIEHFDIGQIISGIPTMRQEGILDAHEREHNHFIFGCVTARSRRIAVEEISDAYLKEGWTQDCIEGGVIVTESWSTSGKNSHTWRNVQIWGFAMVNGERRYVTRIAFTSPLKEDGVPVHVRFVYDYIGAV